LAVFREAAWQDGVAEAISGQGDLLRDRGDLASAEKKYEQALAIFLKGNDVASQADAKLALARVALDRADNGRAADLARQSSEQFLRQKRRDDEARSRALLAQALAAQGKFPEARSEIGRSLALISKTQSRLGGFEIAIASTRVSCFLGQPLHATDVDRMTDALQELAAEAPSAFNSRPNWPLLRSSLTMTNFLPTAFS
jgi:tetratricopeptide (TPR) repeat protein